jgi:hypothetical protein
VVKPELATALPKLAHAHQEVGAHDKTSTSMIDSIVMVKSDRAGEWANQSRTPVCLDLGEAFSMAKDEERGRIETSLFNFEIL